MRLQQVKSAASELKNLVEDAIIDLFKEGTILPISVPVVTMIWLLTAIFVASSSSITNKTQIIVFVTTGYSAWLTFIISHAKSARNLRRSHTLTLLIQSREATNYQNNLKLFNSIWNAITDVPRLSYNQYASWRDSEEVSDPTSSEKQIEILLKKMPRFVGDSEETRRSEMTHALTQLINYYEFLSVGITQRVFDERILRETIRGIFCNFVYSVHDVIGESRNRANNGNPTKMWENIVYMYFRWETNEERLRTVRLGPDVGHDIVNLGCLHGFSRRGLVDYNKILSRPI